MWDSKKKERLSYRYLMKKKKVIDFKLPAGLSQSKAAALTDNKQEGVNTTLITASDRKLSEGCSFK